MECNGLLEPVAEEAVADRVEEPIRARFDRFWRCRACGKIYWRGSHFRRMLQRVRRAVPNAAPGAGAEAADE